MEDLLISLLPIIIIVGVWIYIMWRFKKNNGSNKFVQNQEEMILLLKEINNELKELNKNNISK